MKLFDIQKYLRKNPSAGGKLFRSCDGFFTCAVVIPMLNENNNAAKFFSHLNRAIKNAPDENILVIAVVNCHENSPQEYKLDNQQLLLRLNSNEFKISDIAVIDCTSDGKTIKNGVGEARKNGMDFALNFFDTENFENSLVFSLDADTFVDENYFTGARKLFNSNPGCGALTFNVAHRNDTEVPEALKQYELYLKSYCEGLELASSPYAFYTVGSAFAVRASSYIHAGGMRKLKAGEDFYFLQAAAKSSAVKHCPEITVRPSARFSQRVPFGTGNALQSIADDRKEYTPFPENSFRILKKVLAAASIAENLQSAENFFSAIPPEVVPFFEQHDFPADWKKVTANIPHNQLPSAFKLHWFDGLKTLQFIKFTSRSETETLFLQGD